MKPDKIEEVCNDHEGDKSAYKILVRKPEWRSRRRWENIFIWNLKNVE
jgi:hypothetical protein